MHVALNIFSIAPLLILVLANQLVQQHCIKHMKFFYNEQTALVQQIFLIFHMFFAAMFNSFKELISI